MKKITDVFAPLRRYMQSANGDAISPSANDGKGIAILENGRTAVARPLFGAPRGLDIVRYEIQ
jgi:hypothetical protein